MGIGTTVSYSWVCGPCLVCLPIFFFAQPAVLAPFRIGKGCCDGNPVARTAGRCIVTFLLCLFFFPAALLLIIGFVPCLLLVDLLRLVVWALTLGCCFQKCDCSC